MSSCFISAANIVLPGNIFPISELIRRKLKTHNSQNSHRATHLTSPRVPDNYRWELWRCLWNGNVQHFRYSPEKRANKNQRQVSNLNNDSQIGKMAANPDKTRIVYASFFFFFGVVGQAEGSSRYKSDDGCSAIYVSEYLLIARECAILIRHALSFAILLWGGLFLLRYRLRNRLECVFNCIFS